MVLIYISHNFQKSHEPHLPGSLGAGMCQMNNYQIIANIVDNNLVITLTADDEDKTLSVSTILSDAGLPAGVRVR